MSSKVNSRLLSKSRFCPTRVKDHNPQCEVFFLKCQQNVFWHRDWVVESCGFARGFCRGKRSREWHVKAVGSKGREGRDNSVAEKCRAGVFQQEDLVRRRRIVFIPVFLLLLCVILYHLLSFKNISSWLYYPAPHGNRQVRVCSWGRNWGAKAAPTAGEGSGSNPWEWVLCSRCHWGVGRGAAMSSGG